MRIQKVVTKDTIKLFFIFLQNDPKMIENVKAEWRVQFAFIWDQPRVSNLTGEEVMVD